jgi:hypothetical protein
MRIIVLSIALTLLNCSLVQGQDQAFDQQSLQERGPLSTTQEALLLNKRDLIIREVVSVESTAEWVGSYGLEDGPTSGAQLDWAPANGFLVRWSTCSHGWADRVNFGGTEFRDGTLRLKSDLGAAGQKVYQLGPELVAVKWGDQHYLVPSDRLIAFSHAARNADRSYEIEEYFLKNADREKRRFGQPQVAAAYQKYVAAKSIQATILEVRPQLRPGAKRLILNAGRSAGIGPGMKFFAVSPKSIYLLAEVVEVSENNAEVYVITSGFNNQSNGEVRPRAGWRLTSRAPKRAHEYYPR